MFELNSIYIGTLYFSYDYRAPFLLNNLSKEDKIAFKIAKTEYRDLLQNGGIIFKNEYLENYVNPNTYCSYRALFCPMIKNGDEYLSLVNNQTYKMSNNFEKNAISLGEVHKLIDYLPNDGILYYKIGIDYLNEILASLFSDGNRNVIYRTDSTAKTKDYLIANVIAKKGFKAIDNLRLYEDSLRQALLKKNGVSNQIFMVDGSPYFFNRVLLLEGKCLQDNIDYENNKELYDIEYMDNLLKFLREKRIVSPPETDRETALKLYRRARK